MSDLPKDDGPGASAQPDTDTTRTERWTPATDAGSESETKPKGKSSQSEPRPPQQPVAVEPVAEDAAEAAEPEAEAPTPPGERIAKAMARAGIASRRDAEAMILAGRVSVNGETLTSPARNVSDDDTILIDGERMPARERSRLWIFHKPRGLVTTARDPEGRQTVFEVLPEDLPRVVAVGRLDINTEGLLLLTNDGGLAKVIAHPDTGWLRRYRVRAHGDTDQAQLDKLAKGVTIDGMEYGPIEATLDRVQGDNLWLTLGLREGKNREVKRILEHLGLSVNRLIRLSFGPFQLGDLEVGLVEEVRMRVLKDQLGKALAEQAGVDFESPVREPIGAFGSPKKAERAPSPSSTRNAARPAPAPRVSTGGAGSGPRRSAWRSDEESGKPRAARVPRRGEDPRASQAAAAERGHERVGSIRTGDRRVVVERLSASPVAPAPEEQPRRRYADRGAPDGAQRGAPGRSDRESWGNRGPAPRTDRGASDRPGFGDRSGPRDAPRGAPGRRDDARRDDTRRDDRRDGRPPERRDRPFGGSTADGPPRGNGGFRSERSGPGGKPAFGGPKPAGARPGGKPGGFGGKPGGFAGKSGGFAGKSSGGFGGKSAGGFAGKGPGGKPGGRPGGFKGGGKPGGGGGGGGGRPPRGGR